jgi:hypothetical protein
MGILFTSQKRVFPGTSVNRIALTRPSTIGVSSGFSDGNASTAPLTRRRATAAENYNKKVLLIPISFSSAAEEEKMKTPTPLRNQRDNILSLR